MKCTSCKIGRLQPGYLDDLFPAHTCNHCGGHYVMLDDYLKWLEHTDDDIINQAQCNSNELELVQEQATETKHALICPIHGNIMLKYRISKDTAHRIDINPATNGIWLDKGEWTLIKSHGLAGCLNKIFTAPWQRDIKEKTAASVLAGNYLEQFGQQDYDKIKDIRKWLDSHPKRNLLVAYLAAKEPYSAIR